MHGNLQDIDLSSLLNLMESQQKSGVVFIEQKSPLTDTFDNYSFIFFYLGKIVYAGNNESFNILRLQHYLTYYQLDTHLKAIGTELTSSASIIEYEGLLLLSEKQIISYQQQKQILSNIIKECLFQILPISQGFFTLNFTYFLQPQIYTFKLAEILPQVFLSLRKWQQFSSYFNSPDCNIFINNLLETEKFISTEINQKLTKQYQKLSHINQSISLKQLARYLHQDLGDIAQLITPCFLHGSIDIKDDFSLKPLKGKEKRSLINIICITEDQNWALNTDSLLSPDKYNFMIASDINQGLKNIFTEQPDLILFAQESDNFSQDYDNISKYKFCQIIKNTPTLSHVPIILIVDNFVFAENLRAKMSGATEYTTKKIINKYLFNIIEKYTMI